MALETPSTRWQPARRIECAGDRAGRLRRPSRFDPATVADKATFTQPHQYPVGIPHVMVNGQFVLRDGDATGVRAGRVVRPGRIQ
jgi:N-acyl-D-aspartate/D-glutamate deacylase